MQCTYCPERATQEARDTYYGADEPLAWMPVCTQCVKLDEWAGVQTRPLTCEAPSVPHHFHVVNTEGFHPNNAWHHYQGNLYTLGGSAYSFTAEQLHACYGPAQPYGRCMSF